MLLIDAHVHIYDCYDLEKFFDSAYENFRSEAEKKSRADNFTGILLLAETSNDSWFHRLSSYADRESLPSDRKAGNWRFRHTDERCTLHARSDDDRELFIVTGRQFLTLEGLEVLCLASTCSFPESTPIEKLIANVLDTGGMPVIPWGFGKWIGRRGKVLKALIQEARHDNFFLGDNGGRPSFISVSDHFSLAKEKGIRILPGSDPLPFESEQKRVGSFGISLEIEIDMEHPVQSIKKAFFEGKKSFDPYGSEEKSIRFIIKQIRIQLRKIVH